MCKCSYLYQVDALIDVEVNGKDEEEKKKKRRYFNLLGGSPMRKDKSQDFSLFQYVASVCFPVRCSKV